jgi:type I restriction enzyme, S subunit
MANEWPKLPVEALKAEGAAAIAIGPFGSRMKADLYTPTGVPVIRGNNLSDTREFVGDFVYVSPETADGLASCNVYRGDLVFPHRGAIGEVGIVPEDGAERYMLSTSLMKLTCNRMLVDPLFLFYFFRSPIGRYELLKNASTVGTPGIGQPLTSLKSIMVPLPSMVEQRAIAVILGKLDDKIDLNRQINQTLEAIAQALFKSWFVDFDPVRAKEEGRLQSLSNHVADLFPDSLEGSDFGEGPKGWVFEILPVVVDVNPSRTLTRGDNAPYLDMANMPTRDHSPNIVIDRLYSSGMRFMNGDTLVARITPCLENGKTAYVDFLEDGQVGWGSTEYIVLRPNPPLPGEYAYCLARSQEFRDFAIQSMTGTSGRQRVPVDSLDHFIVALPSEKVAGAFGRVVKPLFARARAAVEQNRTLGSLRDALLPKLVAGEIRIKDAERIVGSNS